MKIPEEVVDARKFLEAAERETNPERKIEKLEEGVELLDLYLEDHPDISDDTHEYITKLRRAHTRRLLLQLISFKQIEVESWLQYIVLLVTKLKNEMDYETSKDQALKKSYDEFRRIHDEDLRKALKLYSDCIE